MNFWAHIFFLGMGWYIVSCIFKDEKLAFKRGKTNPYLKVRKTICSEEDFIEKLKVRIFRSFIIGFFWIGLLAFVTYAYCEHMTPKGVRSLGALGNLSALEYLSMWVSFSTIAMGNRFIKAYHAR